MTGMTATQIIAAFARRHRFRPMEALPWLLAIAAYFVFPDYLALGAQIIATMLFGLSADLVLGYAGIVTLGHAAFYGVGAYTAGYLAAHGIGTPFVGLLAAMLVAGSVGFISGLIILRTQGLSILMLTLVVCVMLQEAANKMTSITGGADGLQGMEVGSVLGFIDYGSGYWHNFIEKTRFDMYGHTAYWYALAALFLGWLVTRTIVHSSFGRSLTGIRENVARMHAIGTPVFFRLVTIYTISAAIAGAAGALIAQTTQLVALNVLSVDLSGTILVMIILGGVGRLYGAFIGVPLYMIAQDRFSTIDPTYWYFWIGLLLVLVVAFARGGILGMADALLRRFKRPR
jgi:branched-chain amino acid transport system permease protein